MIKKSILGLAFGLGIAALCLSLFSSFLNISSFSPTKEEAILLEKKMRIANEIRYTIQPKIYKKEGGIAFHIILESYENTDAIAMDLMDITFLTDQDETPFLPTSWKSKDTSAYKHSGILYFGQLALDQVTSFTLSFFELEEQKFHWSATTRLKASHRNE